MIPPYGPTLKYQPELECMDRPALTQLQTERLRWTVGHAYENVSHTRKSMDARGVTPNHIKCLADIRHLPFTVKNDLRTHYPFGLFAVPREKVIRLHASSGTTGTPTVVGYTRDDLDMWADLMARSLACAGARPGDVVHNALGYGLFTGGLGFHGGAERLGCTVTPISGGGTERQIKLLRDFGAQVLIATPSYALHLAEAAALQGEPLADGPLHAAPLGGEPWTDSLRRQLDEMLGLQSVDSYGLSEIIGPGVAMECRDARDGAHGWEDAFLFEIIDPESGEPLPVGETGELVITTLTKQALPMIRYRTRDITSLTDEPCACGRTHLRIRRVTGRNDDMLIIRGVNMFPTQVEALLVGMEDLAPHYQLVVRRDGTMDNLTIEAEARPDVSADDYPKIAKKVENHIKTMIGVSCRAMVKEPGAVPRSEGKAVRVRDLRGSGKD
ncbi:phenylacetate--CoA ligase family protein [Magnetospira sp. QH-2]|uniref:phenylacetate--CoA ligase family protein n=1 Tax=Magnetospira sp. (strain QH-2) TaxID=1288970 RepID=UPI0003E80ED0|nr:phenylacetate--CoA ligase [Magnetospira sp. QH-2]CCQ73677.1 Phenylacetate-coenzyme A ligase [Magnetospira sp. QH-2]